MSVFKSKSNDEFPCWKEINVIIFVELFILQLFVSSVCAADFKRAGSYSRAQTVLLRFCFAVTLNSNRRHFLNLMQIRCPHRRKDLRAEKRKKHSC